jgi:hypothetical protein
MLEFDYEIPAEPDEIVELMLSDAFLDQLVEEVAEISDTEETKREEVSEGELERVVRYQAPTRVPKFLSRYEEKAPEHVYWEERGSWDLDEHVFTYEIVPEVPEHWHEKYDTQGRLEITSIGGGRSRVDVTINYEVRVFGLRRIIEKALEGEARKLLETQRDIVERHFR